MELTIMDMLRVPIEPPNTEFRKFLEFQLRLHSLAAKTSNSPHSIRQHVQMCFLVARQLGLITKD